MLFLRTFGGARLTRTDGGVVGAAATQRRPLALLSLLAVAGARGVSRDRILGLLWAEHDPEKARHALTQTLYHIRRALGCDDLFLLSGANIALNPCRVGSDVEDFAAHVEHGEHALAVALYAGPFLDGFFLSGSSEFEFWVSQQRQAFVGSARAALSAIAAARE